MIIPDGNDAPVPDPNPETVPAANPAADGLLLVSTIVVPPGAAQPVIDNQEILKIVVIGNYPDLANNADTAATMPAQVGRKVIWFTDVLPDNYQKQFKPDADVVAFSLSLNNEVKGIVTDPNADYTVMEELFDQAGE